MCPAPVTPPRQDAGDRAKSKSGDSPHILSELARYSESAPVNDRLAQLEAVFRQMATLATPPTIAGLSVAGIIGQGEAQRFAATAEAGAVAVSMSWLLKQYGAARLELDVATKGTRGLGRKSRDYKSAAQMLVDLEVRVFKVEPIDRVVRIAELDAVTAARTDEAKRVALEAVFKAIVAQVAGGDGTRLRAEEIIGLDQWTEIAAPGQTSGKSYKALLADYQRVCYRCDNEGREPTPDDLKDSRYYNSTLVLRIQRDALGIAPAADTVEVKALKGYRADLPAKERKAVLEAVFKEIVATCADGDFKRLTATGIRGRENKDEYFGPAGEHAQRDRALLGTWIIRYAFACYHFDKGADADPSVTVSNIPTQAGYTRKDAVLRLQTDAFASQKSEDEYIVPTLAKHKARGADLEVLKAVLKDIVAVRGGDPKKLVGFGIPGDSNQVRYKASANGAGFAFRSLVLQYALASYKADHGGNPPEKEEITTITKRDGYSLAKTVLRIQKEVFGVTPTQESVEVEALSNFSADLPAKVRIEKLERFFLQLLKEHSEGDTAAFRSAEPLGARLGTYFSDPVTKVAATYVTWFRAYAYAVYQDRLGDKADPEVSLSTVLRQKGFTILDIRQHFHQSCINRAAAEAAVNEPMLAVSGFLLGSGISPTAVAPVTTRPYYTIQNGYTVVIGMANDKPLVLSLPEGRYTDCLIVPHLFEGKPRLEVRITPPPKSEYFSYDEGSKTVRRESPKGLVIETFERAKAELLPNLDTETIRQIALKHNREYLEVLWQLVGWRLGGALDQETIREVIGGNLLEELKDASKKRAAGTFSGSGSTSGDIEDEGEPMSAEQVNTIATTGSLIEGQQGLRSVQFRNFLARLVHDRAAEIGVVKSSLTEIIDGLREEARAADSEVLREAYGQEVERVQRLGLIVEDAGSLGLTTQLRLNQLWAIDAALVRNSVYAGDSMGGGKTRLALVTFALSKSKEGLAVVPKMAMTRWLNEMTTTFLPDKGRKIEVVLLADEAIPAELRAHPRFNVTVVKGIPKAKSWIEGRGDPEIDRLILTTPEYFRDIWKDGGEEFPFFAVDEATLFKNDATGQGATLLGKPATATEAEVLGVGGVVTILMSGTPVENGPEDLMVPVKVLARRARGIDIKGHETIANATIDELNGIYRRDDWAALSTLAGYFAAHLVRNNHPTLVQGRPKVVTKTVRVSAQHSTFTVDGVVRALPNRYVEQTRLYDLALHDPNLFEVRYGNAKTQKQGEGALQVLRLMQANLTPAIFNVEGPSATIDALREILKLHPGKRFVIGSEFASVARDVFNQLSGQYNTAFIDGSVVNTRTNAARAIEVQKLQDGTLQGLVVTLGTMGMAEELTNADILITLGLPFKPTVLDQFRGRADRPDPIRNPPGKILNCYHVVSVHDTFSIDAALWNLLDVKRVFHKLLVQGSWSPELIQLLRTADDNLLEDARPLRAESEAERNFARAYADEINPIVGNADNLPAMFYEIAVRRHRSVVYGMTAFAVCVDKHWSPTMKNRVLDLEGATLRGKRMDIVADSARDRGIDVKFSAAEHKPKVEISGRQATVTAVYDTAALAKQFSNGTVTHIHLGSMLEVVDDPAALLGACAIIAADDAIMTIVLPPAPEEDSKLVGCLAQVGWAVESNDPITPPPGALQRSQQFISRNYGMKSADDLSRAVIAGARLLVARKVDAVDTDSSPAAGDLRVPRIAIAVPPDSVADFSHSPIRKMMAGEKISKNGGPPSPSDPAAEVYFAVLGLVYQIQCALDEIGDLDAQALLDVKNQQVVRLVAAVKQALGADTLAPGTSPHRELEQVFSGLSTHSSISRLDPAAGSEVRGLSVQVQF